MVLSPASLLLRRSSAAYSVTPLPVALVSILKNPPFLASARSLSATPLPTPSDPPDSPIPSLSSRLSFVFDQIDSIDRNRAAKDAALQRIRAWHQNKPSPPPPPFDDGDKSVPPMPHEPSPNEVPSVAADETMQESMKDVLRKEVELVHPWPEWIELMERLVQQNYFDFRRTDEDRVAENLSIDLTAIEEEVGLDFSRDWTTVRNACMNFGRDRFDILRSLSRKDIQILVGHGCPNMDPKVVFSAKLLRKLVHLDEGDVCSSCSLRNSCGRGYILTRKEDEARTLDVMRILLTFGFDHVKETVENKALTRMKSVKVVVRKLLHEIVKLSAVPIDPNLPPPVIKKPPPKVKQPPPPPKRRVGRDDVEMKKGDWLCTKCDFMNFAKNTVCLQCDAKRPKRQLLPGEWECPQCNFLNYRRNIACFHCDHKRPPDAHTEDQIHAKQSGPRARSDRTTRVHDVSSDWNFNFDDNESDGADVAAFEFADSNKRDQGSLDNRSHRETGMKFEGDTLHNGRVAKSPEQGRYFEEAVERKSTLHSHRSGFDDFDDEDDDVDSYELDSTQANKVSRMNFSELEKTSESEGSEEFDHNSNQSAKDYMSNSEDDGRANHPYWHRSRAVDSRQEARGRGAPRDMSFGSDDDSELNSDSDEMDQNFRSKQENRHQAHPHRARRGLSDSDDDLLHGMESDDDGLHFRGNEKRRNFTSRDSQNEFENTDRLNGRRNSFTRDRDSYSSRRFAARGNGTGASHRNFKEDSGFQHFDRRGEERFDFKHQGRRNERFDSDHQGRRNERFDSDHQGRRNERFDSDRQGRRNERFDFDRQGRRNERFDFDRQGRRNEIFDSDHRGRRNERFDSNHQGRKNKRFDAGNQGKRNQFPDRTRSSRRNERSMGWE
ncbi:hypothetical protein Cni_G24621 [Canna indica]|uniref:RanBP2-type domain-containing protein n=1 Tax=Canna indica TaxID=4628 RepID=A0AAQ3QPR1_9LILI|nr:hypothetical protein Cni_G24621 [Canna indica]